MGILKSHERDYVANVFRLLKEDVRILFFTHTPEDQTSRETRQILEEVSSFSKKIGLTGVDPEKEADMATRYGIDKWPATIIAGKKDLRLRHFGSLSGFMVSAMVEAIVQVSKNVSDLSDVSKEKLSVISEPRHLQIFTRPDSPYCPTLVNIAHRMAIESEYISADSIDITKFPHLAMRFNVKDVPFTVVNDRFPIAGALDEKDFIERVFTLNKKNG